MRMCLLECLGGLKFTTLVIGPVQSNHRLLSHCALDASLWSGCGDVNSWYAIYGELGAFDEMCLELLSRVEDLQSVVRVGRRCE